MGRQRATGQACSPDTARTRTAREAADGEPRESGGRLPQPASHRAQSDDAWTSVDATSATKADMSSQAKKQPALNLARDGDMQQIAQPPRPQADQQQPEDHDALKQINTSQAAAVGLHLSLIHI